LQILCKKTQNISLHAVHSKFCKGRKAYDCVATFASPYRPDHLPTYPGWIADGVAMKGGQADNYVQYFSPRGLASFLHMVRRMC
jgi:hypothetical protein